MAQVGFSGVQRSTIKDMKSFHPPVPGGRQRSLEDSSEDKLLAIVRDLVRDRHVFMHDFWTFFNELNLWRENTEGRLNRLEEGRQHHSKEVRGAGRSNPA